MHIPLRSIVFVLVLATHLAHADAPVRPAAQDASKRIPVQVTWDQKIPMRDGVQLSATLYRDPAQARPLPVIFALTPYIAESVAKRGVYFAQHGYVVVAVDSRGRGNSDGSFVPGRVEAKDGYDAIEWIAKQPWCDGQVAMWGGSWLGFTQWSVAKERPPHLKTIVPTAAVYPGVDFPFHRGIAGSYTLRWLAMVHGKTLNSTLLEQEDFWGNVRWELASGRAFQDLEAITGIRGTQFRTWIDHPREDAFWQAITPSAADYARLQIPVLTITGHYDGDQPGALAYYDRHLAHARKDADARHWLVIGPWSHEGTRNPTEELGGVHFGTDALVAMEPLHLAWYDHVMKGAPPPAFLKDRVMCFIMGRNVWVSANRLAQIEGAPLRLALDATGAAAGDVLHGGRLAAAPAATRATVTLISDPKYVPPRDEPVADEPAWLKGQRSTYATRPDHVEWHSAPFEAETVLAGRPRVTLQLAVDQPDADVRASLTEVLADGTAIALTDTVIRLRYRKGDTAVRMTPGKPEQIELPPMDFFARSIAKGSRLRLTVGSPAILGLMRNTNTGGDLATEPLSKARVARITVITGPGSGSVLELPRPDADTLRQLATPKAP